MLYDDALKVANADYYVGISSAITELEKLGYDCSSYHETINNLDVDCEDFDEQNILARNTLYVRLGIYEVMLKAYDEIWR